jgi:S-adenosylmethionine:tRNA ribosyltransferase-isomerase
MNLSDFDYHLPKELIASFPPEDRPSARLMRVERTSGKFSHHVFREIVQFLQKGDVLVLNNTKVLPARLLGRRTTGGKVEALLLRRLKANRWQALLKPGGRIKKGSSLTFGDENTQLEAIVMEDSPEKSGQRVIEFQGDHVQEKIIKIGHMPLPPYIDRPDVPIDRDAYQTVYAQKEGAVAAPTAGLHFDQALLSALEEKGIEILYITLHTGYGTFQPITEEDLSRQRLFSEEFEISPATADRVNKALQEKRRVIACGTTSVRALESAAEKKGEIRAQFGETQIFIYPPYEFKIVSGLITNFHIPRSSLLLLVAAFLNTSNDGREKLMNLYKEAIHKSYQFYSYGDAMVIL